MGVKEVIMWQGVCDCAGCDAKTGDDSEFWAWADPGAIIADAQDADWYVSSTSGKPIVLFCPEHIPQCDCPDVDCDTGNHDTSEPGSTACKVRIRDDEWGTRCEECYVKPAEALHLTEGAA